MDTLLREAVLSYNRQEIVRPNLNDEPGEGGAGDRETQRNDDPLRRRRIGQSPVGSEAKPSAPTGWAERKETSAPEGRQSLPETKSSSAPAGAVRYSGAIRHRWVRSASPRFPPAIVRCAFRRRGTSR